MKGEDMKMDWKRDAEAA